MTGGTGVTHGSGESPEVLLVSPSAAPGGAERALAALVGQLPTLDWRPRCVLLEHGELEHWLTAAGCPYEVVEAGRFRQAHLTVSTVRRLAALVRASGCRAVISNQSKGHLYGGPAARWAGVPALRWQHAIPDCSRIERLAALLPAAAVVCSTSEGADAQRLLTPRARIERIPPGIDVRAVASRRGEGRALRRAHGWEDRPTVGIVGRLEPWKGQAVFLRAAALVARAHPTLQVCVVGGAVLGREGSYPEDLRRLAEALPELRDRVLFADHQDDVHPWYDALDVVVHASTAPEPFGLVLIEAMALGRPVVATTGGGPSEIVEDGVSGLLVPPDDVPALAGGVRRLLDDPRLAADVGAAAERRARAFDASVTARRWAGLLDELTAGHPGRRTAGERQPKPRREAR